MLIARYNKPYQRAQPLRDHCANVAHTARGTLSHIGLGALGQICGMLHDVGKSNPTWQNALEQERQRYLAGDRGETRRPLGVPHAPPAARMIYQWLKPLVTNHYGKLTMQYVCMAVSGHHSMLQDAVSTNGDDFYSKLVCTSNSDDRMDAAAFWQEVYPKTELEALFIEAVGEVRQLVKHILKSMNAEGETSEATRQFALGFIARLVYAALVDGDWLDAGRFEDGLQSPPEPPAPPDWDALTNKLEAKLRKYPTEGTINCLRAQVSGACREAARAPAALQILQAPTGSGKTLASLHWALIKAQMKARANGRTRIIYVVSYTTILDQVYDEYHKVFEDLLPGVRLLLHHSNVLPDDPAPDAGADLYTNNAPSLLAERWDADIILTTQVQFFNALFLGAGRAARRMPALQNAVILFDEVQTIPPELTHLFNLAITCLVNLCTCDVLLSSATQPILGQMEFPLPPAHNVMADAAGLYQGMRRVRLCFDSRQPVMTAPELGEFALEKQRKYGSVLVVVNTRKGARLLYDAILGMELQGVELHLLSNDLCPAHRKRIIDYLKEAQNQPIICVSTQLIECGVDLSFGCAIRSLAGADNVLQTAGRCNRHGKLDERPVFIVRYAEENLARLQLIKSAQEACKRVLMETGDADSLQLPETMTNFYRYLYAEGSVEGLLSKNMKVGDQTTTMVDLLSQNPLGMKNLADNGKPLPVGALRQAFRTAGERFEVISSPAHALIVPYEKGGEIILELGGTLSLAKTNFLLHQAQFYSINVFDHTLKNLGNAVHKLPCGALALAQGWYDDKACGLLEEPRYKPEIH